MRMRKRSGQLLILLSILVSWIRQVHCRADKKLEGGYFLSPSKQFACTDANLKIAGQLRENFKDKEGFDKYMVLKDTYIGFPDGKCGFVRAQQACEPTSNFDFLQLYYCSFPRVMGDGWALVLFGGVVVCVSSS